MSLFILEVFLSPSPFSSKVPHSVDLLQLALNGLDDVHFVRDVNIPYIPTSDKEVSQMGGSTMPVRVHNLGQADVHEGIHIDNATLGHAFIPQVHRGDVAVNALEQHHQAVFSDGSLSD